MLHGRPIVRTGHCRKCDQETVHSHDSSGVLRLIHLLTFQLIPRIGIGKWVCVECYDVRLFLNLFSRRRADVAAGKISFELDGNYIVNDFSLVRRSLHNSRYTMKFRDSIVDRIVNGQVDLSTIRSELRVREADVLAWIADRLNRQSERISQLSSLMEAMSNQRQCQLLEADFELENNAAADDDKQHVKWPRDIAGSRSRVVH